MPLFSWRSCLAAGVLVIGSATAYTGSRYALTYEYSGTNFFDGWDFYSGRDPTGGLVTYYSRSSAQLTGLISSSEDGPAYMGVNYVDTIPFNNVTGQAIGAGRPSIRIASKQAFTHGLFIGDFAHIPAGICGTWPAFWTLGPNWPYTGEIDIMEGVNQNTNNIMSLHTNETCLIQGNSSVMTGLLGNTNCAYYPDYNVGCGVIDASPKSFGTGFNQAGGGVYAMQWTSEYIRIWEWPRANIPANVNAGQPDPSSWGLPSAQLGVGNCSIDQHFQSHKIIFDTTFCGEYAGNPYVWQTNDALSCANSTGLATCDNFVSNYPSAFKDAYWSVNYVRVYQLLDPASNDTGSTYIASNQPPTAATNTYTASASVPTLDLSTATLCPQYNFSIISDGTYQYEIACDFDPPGPDIIGDPYYGFQAKSLADCVKGCTYMNENNGTNTCGGVSHYTAINFCYFKKYIDGNIKYRPGYNEIRLIYYGYPQVTDNPDFPADSTLTSSFIETIPTPQTYRPSSTSGVTTTTTMTSTFTSTIELTSTIAAPPMGDNSTSHSKTIPANYSETATSGYLDSTATLPDTTSTSTMATTSLVTSGGISSSKSTGGSAVASTSTSSAPSSTDSTFYIIFNVSVQGRRILKREIQYLAFNAQGQSILVTDRSQATKFSLGSDGILMSATQYVAVDTSVQPPRFSLSDDVPDNPAMITVTDDGNVQVHGVDQYCVTSDGDLAISTDSQDTPDDCVVVSPQVVAALSTSSTSASKPVASTSMAISSTSTTSVRNDSSKSSSTSSSLTSTNPTKTPQTINSFIYAGCFGVPASAASLPGITAPFTDPAMTNEECTKHCGQQNAFYAGTYDTRCFCGSSRDLYTQLLEYPDASCNKPCPGANREICGGDVGFQDAVPTTTKASNRAKRADFEKRQAAIFLISLFNNTVLLGTPGESDVPTTSTSSGMGADTRSSTTTSSSSLLSSSGIQSTTTTFTNIVTSSATRSTSLYFPPNSVSYNVTGTKTATVISTTYVDVCDVCPGGLTTMSTTITIPHCGCTASYDAGLGQSVSVPSPIVPMTTTATTCSCGRGGIQSTITVTVPCQSSIAELSSQLMAMSTPIVSGGNEMGEMASPAPAEAGAQIGNVPLSNEEPAPGVPGNNNVGSEENTVQPPDKDDNEDYAARVNAYDNQPDDDDISDFKWEPETNNAPLTAPASGARVETTSAAPASSPVTPTVPSRTGLPIGISNYTVSVYPVAGTSIPRPGSGVGGGGNTQPHTEDVPSESPTGSISLFKSDASSLSLSLSRDGLVSLFNGNKFKLSLVVGVVLGCVLGVW